MTSQERVSKLQGLLERIQKNASRPRASAPLPPPVAYAAAPPLPAAPPPLAAAAPPAPSPPPPAAYEAPPAVLLDDSVDDLLGLATEASPFPVEVDIPLDTLPPVAEVAHPQAAEEDPIPLVSVATHESAPPSPVDDIFSLESEVSEVRIAAIPREVEEVTVAAIEAEAEPIVAEELSEEDLVDVTDGTPLPATTDADLDFEEEEEQPPASSQRVASTMDEALAAAAARADAEREVPLKTPPPESGPQEAPIPTSFAAPHAPDVDSLLGGELDIPTHAAAPAALIPTPEQLGQTIELEEPRGPTLELAEPAPSSAPPPPAEELEMALPERESAGGYDDLPPPVEARDELEAHRRRLLEEDIAPPPESLATLPSARPGTLPEIVPAVALEAAPLEALAPVVLPETLARPAPMGQAESFTSVRETFRPRSFVELLDASLSLGG